MKVGYISAEQIEKYSSLILPDVVDAIRQDEPLTAMAVEKDGVACGVLAGYVEDACYKIASLYIAPGYRRQGAGKRLVEELEDFLVTYTDIRMIDIEYTVSEEEHEELGHFLKAIEFEKANTNGHSSYIVDLQQVKESKIYKATENPSKYIRPFSQVTKDLLKKTQKQAAIKHTLLPETPLYSEKIDTKISHAMIKDGEIQAFIVFDHSCGDWLTCAALWMGNTNPTILYSLLKTVFQRIVELYPIETKVAFHAVSPETVSIIHSILPNAKEISFRYRYICD